jgi:ligand-binding sensor domain-containing protein
VTTLGGDAYYQPTFQQWYAGGEFPYELARNDFKSDDFPVLTTEFGYSYIDGILTDNRFREYQLTEGVHDDFDDLYVGTWGTGPVVINTRYGDLTRLPYGPYNFDLSIVVEAGDILWIGDTQETDGALSLYDRSTGLWSWFQPRYTDGLASSVLTSGDWGGPEGKATWLGTGYGLVRYQAESDDFRAFADFSSLPSTSVLSVAANSLGVFVGTDNGLGYINALAQPKKEDSNSTDTAENKAEDDGDVTSIPARSLVGFRVTCLEIVDDYLYIGTERGVLRRPLDKNGQFEYVNTPDRMLSTEIYDMARHGDTLYFATYRDIQAVNLKTEESFTITDTRYFDSWRINKIAVDGNNIWAATDMGLWKYRIEDSYSCLFTVNDGMISDYVRGIVLDGDYVWLATPRGLIRFFWNDPSRVD